jgi:hypothetical protein
LEIWARRSPLLRSALLPKESVFQILRLVDANFSHAITHKITVKTLLLKFIQVTLSKVKLKLLEDADNTRIATVLRCHSLSKLK